MNAALEEEEYEGKEKEVQNAVEELEGGNSAGGGGSLCRRGGWGAE